MYWFSLDRGAHLGSCKATRIGSLLIGACVAFSSPTQVEAVSAEEAVASAIGQWDRVQNGHGHSVAEYRWATGNIDTLSVLWQREQWVAFDKERLLSQTEMTFWGDNGERKTFHVEEFDGETWTRLVGSDTSRVESASSGNRPMPHSYEGHPVGWSGLLPGDPKSLLEEAAKRGDFEAQGVVTEKGLQRLLLKGSVVVDDVVRNIEFWLAEERGYLPVKIRMPLGPDYPGECVVRLEYRQYGSGVWTLSAGRSTMTDNETYLTEHTVAFQPDFSVNTGAHPRLEEGLQIPPGTLIIDESTGNRSIRHSGGGQGFLEDTGPQNWVAMEPQLLDDEQLEKVVGRGTRVKCS